MRTGPAFPAGLVTKEEMAEIATRNEEQVDACAELIDLANSRGGHDNITVVIARIEGSELKEPGDDEAEGYQVYPLLDTDSTTEPVPVYKGPGPAPSNEQARMTIAGLISAFIVFAALWIAA